MNDNDIIKIELIKNVRFKNIHNNFIFPPQSILEITFRNNEKRIIDLICEKDVTSIDYFKLIKTPKSKSHVLFEEIKEI